MTSTARPAVKITYATMTADNEELHRAYEQAVERVRAAELGTVYPLYLGGQPVSAAQQFEDRSPIDTRLVVGHFQAGTREHARQAIAAARAAFPIWSGTPWQERVRIMRRAADLISERVFDLAALMSFDVGKNRLEALGDVEEAADLIRYYCSIMEEHQGFDRPMASFSPGERTRSVLKPYGVWAVISPFNFPLALAAGPAGAALIAGNTVVLKPSSDAPALGVKLAELLAEAGLPAGAFNVVTGAGSVVGAELAENPDVAGMTFTGSYEVGFALYRAFSTTYPRPCIAEMGGKNPVIVTARADLDEAAEGVMRAAFGFGGQKCSAAARVYVERPVKEAFLERLVARTRAIRVGDPTRRENWLGPLIRAAKAEELVRRAAEARAAGGQVLTGGRRLTAGELAHGFYVEPTVVADLPYDHPLLREELFLPFVVVVAVESLDAALRLANDTIYGLTAGLYSEDEGEIRAFLDRIQAGVVYVNRRAGATTGAWPGAQPFGGWKGSGSTGRGSGGPYYLQQFLREQSQTIIE